MRTYEAVCVFRPEGEAFSRGRDHVREELKGLGASIVKEDDMGERSLAYPIKKQNRAHYFIFVVEMDPEKAHQTEQQLRHNEDILRFLMVVQEQ
jgi:small subunit ribosomal protein S6